MRRKIMDRPIYNPSIWFDKYIAEMDKGFMVTEWDDDGIPIDWAWKKDER